MKNILIFSILLIANILLSKFETEAQWQMPCDNNCTGDWIQVTKDFPLYTCPPCKVRLFYYYREANCLGLTEHQWYLYEVHIIDCENCGLSYEELLQFGINSLVQFLIEESEEDATTVSQMFLQSCWSTQLMGPHPVMNPCPNNTDCCRYRYTVTKEGELITSIVEDQVLPLPNCEPYMGINCFTICNPNGYLYKMAEDLNTDFLGLFNSELFPNPNKGIFNFIFNSSDDFTYDLIVYNSIGMEVSKYLSKQPNQSIEIDLSKYPTGAYLYNVIQNGKIKSAGRFLIE